MTDAPAERPPTATRVWASGFTPLTVRIFRLVWLASIISNIGSWMQTVRAQWLLAEANSSPLLVAL